MSKEAQAQASYYFHFLAGLSTGVFSASLLQPIDLLKTRVQQSQSASFLDSLKEIVRGPKPLQQLWRGTSPSVVRTGFGSALYFSTLNALRQNVARYNVVASAGAVPSAHGSSRYASSSLPRLSNLANLSTGAIARASVGLVMMPITVIKVRYESTLYSYKSVWGAGAAILRTEGAKGFFSGFGATAIRDAPYAGLYVVFYEQCKVRLSQLNAMNSLGDIVTKNMGTSMAIGTNFVSGVLAAGLATAITNPFDVVKTRLQLMPSKYGNMVKASRQLIKEDGYRSLFDGLGLRMGRKVMSSALAWTLYEELIRRAEGKWKETGLVW
ncbi:MAG: hypothetical protein LQ351_002960 [Letrouitia transgressa]|nr:MAG: hypothetical protein LQ351_002960 [Letrouitia transgressa]